MINDLKINEFVEAANRIGQAGLLKCSSGNMSHREGELVLLSKSGSWLENITENDIAICNLKGDVINKLKPTVESVFHLGILQNRKDINTVLHFQSPNATAVCCLDEEIDFNVIAEIPLYIEKISRVPYILPGSKELANEVINAFSAGANLVLMQNHGLVVGGESYKDVFQKAQFFELACEIILNSNNKAVRLTKEQIKDLDIYKTSK